MEFAQAAQPAHIFKVGLDELERDEAHLEPYEHDKAKISPQHMDSLEPRTDGKPILVTAICPRPAGDGKATTAAGLGVASPTSASAR